MKILYSLLVCTFIMCSVQFTSAQSSTIKPFQNKKGKWGFQDSDKNVLVEPEYDYVKGFVNGLSLVNKGGKPTSSYVTGGKWGVVDANGKLVADTKYDEVEILWNTNGYFASKLNNKWGLFDSSGKEIFPFEADGFKIKWEGNRFGMFTYNIAGKWGVMEFTGREILKPEYDVIGEFSDEKRLSAAVLRRDTLYGLLYSDKTIVAADNYDIQKIDFKTGKIESVVKSIYSVKTKAYDYVNELMLVTNKNGTALKTKTGKEIASGILNNITGGNERYAIYTVDGLKGVLKKTGDVVVPHQFNSIRIDGRNSYTVFVAEKNGVVGALDTVGEIKIQFMYDDLRISQHYHNHCYAYLAKKAGKWQFLDIDGKELTKVVYDTALFNNDFIFGLKFNGSDSIVALDKTCKPVMVPQPVIPTSKYEVKSDAQKGIERMIEKYKQDASCPTCYGCNGTGLSSKKIYDLVKCESCNGSGDWIVKYGYGVTATYKKYACYTCTGGGKIWGTPRYESCIHCNGKGCIQK